MENLWINETFLNRTENYSIGESGWYETAHKNVSALFKALKKEYGGKIKNMYVDDAKGRAKKVGWIFTRRCEYNDVKEMYLQEVWVEVATKQPVRTVTIKVEHATF